MKLLITVLALALAGCASTPTRWYHPTASAADFERDKVQCYYDAKAQGVYAPRQSRNEIVQAYASEMQAQQAANYCLQAKGYHQ